MTSLPGNARKRIPAFALLCCVTLIAYLPALRGGLVWDDDGHVTRPALRSLDGLWRIWFDLGATQQYYPLLHSAFWIEHRLWGDAVLGYHLVNVSLHAAAACLVVAIVQRLRLPGAWLAGFVFALHSVCVEAVAWISEQKSTLSAVFYLSAALVYLRFDEDRRRPHYLLAFALFLAALLSKTVTATLPAALLIVFWWQRGRLGWKRDVVPLLPWFGVGAAAGLFTAWVERTQIRAVGADFDLSPLQRILLAGRVLWFYPARLIWPSNLTFIYPRWTIDPGAWHQYLFPAGALAVAIALLALARRNRGPLAAFLYYGATIFPVLGFLNVYPFRFSYVADHFQYLASLGLIVPAAACIALSARAQTVLIATAAIVLGTLTWRQSRMFQSAETLYRTTLQRNPACWMAHNNLGHILLNRPGRQAEAAAQFREALRLKPDYADAESNLGLSFLASPELRPQAKAAFEAAIRMDPGSATAHNNLGTFLFETPGELPEAIAEYEAALRANPDSAEAHCNLALALSKTPGHMADVIDHLEQALRIDPESPQARRLASEFGVE